MNSFSLNGNYIDLIIVFIVGYFLFEAMKYSFWLVLADFLSFAISLFVSLRLYSVGAHFFTSNFSLSPSLANALGFLVTAVTAETVLGFSLTFIFDKIKFRIKNKSLEKLLSLFPAIGESFILISFFLTLLISMPVAPQIKTDISHSKIGSYLVARTAGLEKNLKAVFGGVVEDTLTYLTIEPGSTETVPVKSAEKNLQIDSQSEHEMLTLVNDERRKRGISELVLREEVVPVARAHAKDMWEREYFGHYSPDGEDVANRLKKEKVNFSIAGENLALAPTLATAHTGLMNSEGHRRNILDPGFRQIGIGVIDNGVYGKMFVQVFTN